MVAPTEVVRRTGDFVGCKSLQAYANELTQLQDQVPAFSSEQAREILMKELNLPDAQGSLVGPKGVFRSLSQNPVAAASIGCVFKGELADGRQVAVKVRVPQAGCDFDCNLYCDTSFVRAE